MRGGDVPQYSINELCKYIEANVTRQGTESEMAESLCTLQESFHLDMSTLWSFEGINGEAQHDWLQAKVSLKLLYC